MSSPFKTRMIPFNLESVSPIGSIVWYAAEVAAKKPNFKASMQEDGWFVCDGTKLNAVDYPELAAVWPVSNGKMTLPNLPEGQTFVSSLGASGGDFSKVGTKTSGKLPNIWGTVGHFAAKGGSANFYCEGAFEAHRDSRRNITAGDEGNVNASFHSTFDASRCNSLYSDSTSYVQTAGVYAVPLIKVF